MVFDVNSDEDQRYLPLIEINTNGICNQLPTELASVIMVFTINVGIKLLNLSIAIHNQKSDSAIVHFGGQNDRAQARQRLIQKGGSGIE